MSIDTRQGNGPEEFDSDVDNEAAPTKASNLKGLWANPQSRKVMIVTIAAVTLALGLVAVKISNANRQQEAQQVSVAGQSKVSPPPSDVREGPGGALAGNEQYNKMVAEAVASRASEALAAGESTMPPSATFVVTQPGGAPGAGAQGTAATPASSMPTMHNESGGTGNAQAGANITNPAYAPGAGQQQPQQAAAPQQMSAAEQAEQARLQAIQAETYASANSAIASLVSQRRNTLGMVSVGKASVQQEPNAQQLAAASQAQPGVGASAANQGVTLISAGEIEAARLDMAVNTDVSTEWVGTVLTGRYAGAKVIGTVERRGTLAHLMVNTLSFPAQRQSVPAAAVALDATTLEAGNATDVDRKLFIRYGVKPLAAGFAAVAQYLQSAGTTVVVNGATVSQTVPELTNKRAGQLVAGSAAQQIANDTTAMDTTPTVRVARGTVIGIFFLKPVIYNGGQSNS